MYSIELFLIVVAIIHLILVIFTLRDLFTLAQIRLIGKVIWVIVIVYPLIVGPLIYLQYGRGERSWYKKIQELQQRAQELHSQSDNSKDK